MCNFVKLREKKHGNKIIIMLFLGSITDITIINILKLFICVDFVTLNIKRIINIYYDNV